MGWTRGEGLRLYRDGYQTYLLVDISRECLQFGGYEAIANVLIGREPSLGSCMLSPEFLRKRCRRVAWNELPLVWKNALRQWLEVPPCKVRGFWRSGHRNNPRKKVHGY